MNNSLTQYNWIRDTFNPSFLYESNLESILIADNSIIIQYLQTVSNFIQHNNILDKFPFLFFEVLLKLLNKRDQDILDLALEVVYYMLNLDEQLLVQLFHQFNYFSSLICLTKIENCLKVI
jgi:hypothetical protein